MCNVNVSIIVAGVIFCTCIDKVHFRFGLIARTALRIGYPVCCIDHHHAAGAPGSMGLQLRIPALLQWLRYTNSNRKIE
jgi:hypothetical protein